MYKSVERVVAEYVFTVGNFPFRIKGRVTEKLGGELAQRCYPWTVSHFYKMNKEAAGPTYPTKTEGTTKEEAERLLYTYVRNFTDIAEPNAFY